MKLSTLLLSVILLTLISKIIADCEPLYAGDFSTIPPVSPSVCSNILDYSTEVCQSTAEANVALLPIVNSLVSEECALALNKGICSYYFPKCTETEGNTLCIAVCQDITGNCSTTEQQTIASVGYNITKYCPSSSSTTTCISGPTAEPTVDDLMFHKCATYSGSVCADSVPGLVYIPPGFTEEILESIAASQQFTFALAPTPTGCDVYHQAFVCSNIFMECDTSLGFSLPRLPCRDFCETYSESCASFFELMQNAGSAAPNCTQQTFGQVLDCNGAVVSQGQSNFPDLQTIFYQSAHLNITTNCTIWASEDNPTEIASAVTTVNSICPAPLLKADENTPDHVTRILSGACSPGCPVDLWTDSEYSSFDKISLAGSVISFIFLLFLTLTWTLFKTSRQSDYVRYMNFCLVVLYIIFIVNSIRTAAIGAPNSASSFCVNPYEEYHMRGWCVVQGVLLIYSVFAGVSWWLVQGIDVFKLLVLGIRVIEGSKTETYLRIGYHVFAWTIPAICIIVALAKEQIGGFTGGIGWCFFSKGRYNQDQTDYSIGLFYYPMFIYTLLGCFLMIIVIIRLWLLSRSKNNNDRTQVNTWDKSLCIVYLRVVIYFFLMSIIWFYVYGFQMYSRSKTGEWEKGVSEFYTCLLVTQYLTGEDCGVTPETRMSFSTMAFLCIITAFSGSVTLFMNATTRNIYVSWSYFIYQLLLPCVELTTLKNFALKHAKPGDTFYQQTSTQSAAVPGQTSNGTTTGAYPEQRSKRSLFKGSALNNTTQLSHYEPQQLELQKSPSYLSPENQQQTSGKTKKSATVTFINENDQDEQDEYSHGSDGYPSLPPDDYTDPDDIPPPPPRD